MANISQFIDHVNRKMAGLYKEGFWLNGYVTKLALDSDGVILVETIDVKKFDTGKGDTRIVMRILEKDRGDILHYFSKYLDELFETRISVIERGTLALHFRVMPTVHWLGEFYPIIREITTSGLEADKGNIEQGLNVGIENSLLSLPDNHRSPWDERENEMLRNYYIEQHFTVEALSVAMRRTPISIVDQLIKIKALTGKNAFRVRNKVLENFG